MKGHKSKERQYNDQREKAQRDKKLSIKYNTGNLRLSDTNTTNIRE
jgi:hypothetical protein